jgi:NADPH:quinone reductase-like Zn-dependent oxidoreductase
MKAAIVSEAGAVPEYGDFPEPAVREGYGLVELVASGLHPVVRSIASGRHYGSTGAWPLVPGLDAVARTPDGDLVFTGFIEPPYGTMAERMASPAALRVPLPPGADPVRIAGGMNPGLSSWMPLTTRKAEVAELGTVVILGATGTAGGMAVQNARVLGARRVAGVGRNPEALERAAGAGAVVVPLRGNRDVDAASIAAALAGDAPSIVLDFLWGAPAEATFQALGRRGISEDAADIAYIQIGATAGAEAAVPASLLRSRRLRISGSGAGSGSIAKIVEQLPIYMRLIADGSVTVPTSPYPLSRIAEAWAASAQSGSRVVVIAEPA